VGTEKAGLRFSDLDASGSADLLQVRWEGQHAAGAIIEPALPAMAAARAASLKTSCPHFAEALQRTRDLRIGVKIKHVQLDAVPQTLLDATISRAADDEFGAEPLLHYLKRGRTKNGLPRKRSVEPPMILFSHLLKFKRMEDAVFFRLRWRL
jgi:hypothetical protein